MLRVNKTSPYIYQSALLQVELHEIFDSADRNTTASVMASNETIHAYKAAIGAVVEDLTGDTAVQETKVEVEEGTECPICYEEIHSGGNEPLEHCHVCRKHVHR